MATQMFQILFYKLGQNFFGGKSYLQGRGAQGGLVVGLPLELEIYIVKISKICNNYCDTEIICIFSLSFFMRIGNITQHDLGSL